MICCGVIHHPSIPCSSFRREDGPQNQQEATLLEDAAILHAKNKRKFEISIAAVVVRAEAFARLDRHLYYLRREGK